MEITDLSTIASDVILAGSPSAGGNYNLNFAPVSFTLTPTDTITISTSGTVTVTDAGGKSITFYKAALDSELLAGQSYEIKGYVIGFNTAMQIMGASVVAVPEPGTISMFALGIGALLWNIRRKSKSFKM